jgi:hypothetical protein
LAEASADCVVGYDSVSTSNAAGSIGCGASSVLLPELSHPAKTSAAVRAKSVSVRRMAEANGVITMEGSVQGEGGGRHNGPGDQTLFYRTKIMRRLMSLVYAAVNIAGVTGR